eukprot:scaffold6290_cov125-Isochrysis_galbana.AAC.10
MPHSAMVRASVLPPGLAYVAPPPCGVFDVEFTTFDAIEVPPRDGVFFVLSKFCLYLSCAVALCALRVER